MAKTNADIISLMPKINIPQMKQVLKHIVMEQNEPCMFVGQFGMGKTDGAEQFAEENNIFLHKVLLGQYDTVDLKGTPWVTDLLHPQAGDSGDVGRETPAVFKATVWHPASTLPVRGNPLFPTDRPILLFLDELTSASTPVMGVCYQLVNERRVGEHVLMDNVRICAAGNRDNDKGIVNRIPLPLCNRFTWFETVVDAEAWMAYAASKNWPGVIIGFIGWQKILLNNYDPDKPEKVVATPRTWAKACKYYNAAMPESVKAASIAGAIGQGVSHQFWAFVDSWKAIMELMPDIRKNPEKAKVPTEPSMQYAVALSISGELALTNSAGYQKYIVRLPAEFQVLIWQLAVKRDQALFKCDEFVETSHRLRSIFANVQ